jgi:diguanylate cyclase (GGDEF)-like protein/PAS domain S-box-containing protein
MMRSLASRRKLAVDLGLSLWLAVVYFLLARIGMLLSVQSAYTTVVALPAGLALAAILLGGQRLILGVAAGAFAAHYSTSEMLAPALVIALGNCLTTMAAAWLLQRKFSFSRTLEQPRDLLQLIGIGAFAAPIIAASIGVTVTLAMRPFSWGNWPALWAAWWAGDALGVLLLTPLLLAWRAHRDAGMNPTSALALSTLQLAVGACVFMLHTPAGVYVYVTLAIVGAMHIPLTGVMLINLLTFGAAAFGVLIGAGPFSDPSLSDSLLILQTYGLVSSLAALLVSALTAERSQAEKELRRSLQRFQQLTALNADWYWEQDENLRFTQLAGRAVDQRQIDVASLLGRTRWEIEALDAAPGAREAHDRAVAERQAFHDIEITRRTLAPDPRVISVSGAPIFDENGRFHGYRGVARDVTLQKQAEHEIAEAKRFLDALISSIPAPILVKDESSRYVAANASFCKFFGREAADILGKTDYDFFTAEQAALFRSTDDQALHGENVEYEHAYEVPGGTRWMLTRKSSLTRPDGSRLTVLVLIDVTARREAEQQVRASEQRFRSLTELSTDWFWEQDAQFRFTRISGAAHHAILAQLQQHLGCTLWAMPGQDAGDERWSAQRKLMLAQQSFRDLELAFPLASGGLVHMSLNGEPMFDAHGICTGYRGTATDITERKLAQQRIARLKDMYAAMSEANSAIIHSASRQQLFESICNVAVEYVHFASASIVLLDGASTSRQVAAQAVHCDSGLQPQQTHAADRALAEQALRTGVNTICNNVLAEPRSSPWRDTLTQLGMRSFATLVLRRQGRGSGALLLYATQPGFFDEELTGLLDKLTLNISFALDNFQREAARRDAENALRESETRFRDFAHAAGEYVWETDLEGRFTYVSSRVQSVWGYSDQELIGRKPAEFMPPGEAERVEEWLKEQVAADRTFRDLEHMIVTRSGDTRWLLNSGVGIFNAAGEQTGWRGTGRDVTDRKSAEARISYLATRDPLTELPNRVLFNDRLEQGIVAARRTGASLALMFIDLDRFKNINDSLGHQVGDQLLKQVAARMLDCIRKGDTLSRLGGDEFVVTLEGLQQAEDAAQVAAKIIKALSRPFEISGHTLNTSCSIGISIFPLDAEDERALMKNADTAMYHAKEKGRNNYQFFSPEMNTRAVERHTLETALRQAIEHQQFKLYYQPLVDMHTGKVVGVESLLRWDHPQRGLLAPGTFIGVAEESGLIEPIGQWVLRTACQRAKAWQDAGYPPLKVAVNISARQLLRPREFARGLSRVLSATGLEPRYLELEMTESLLIQNAEENIAVLRKLGQDGMRIAVDDFGTGYSSLSYLRQLPIDTLKIDRSFVRDVESDPEDAAIIQAIVAMGHSLGLQVTAEGVETRGQLEALSRLQCDEYQGYLFSRPLAAVEIAARFLAPGVLDFESAAAKRREVGT